MFVSRSTHERALRELAKVEAENEVHTCTIVRLAGEVDALTQQLKTAEARPGTFTADEAELRRRLGLSEGARRSLEEQLLPLQRANEAMAAELRDLREGSEARA